MAKMGGLARQTGELYSALVRRNRYVVAQKRSHASDIGAEELDPRVREMNAEIQRIRGFSDAEALSEGVREIWAESARAKKRG